MLKKNKGLVILTSLMILLPMVAFIFPVLIIVLLGPSLITIVEVFQ